MGIALDITHIGEALVAYLLENNETVQNNFKKLLGAGVKAAWANKPIDNDSDSMHRIDVLVKSDKTKYIAIEVKLGTAITTPGAYCTRYLSKGDNDKKGNMLNKLASGNLRVKTKDIEKKWILLVRSNQIKDKLSTEKCRLGEKNKKLWEKVIANANCKIISLEELIAGISPKDFNKSVNACIKSDNYLEEWGIKLSGPFGVSGLSQEN